MDMTCRWCGSDCIDDTDERGFWCGDCDGYTYFDEKQDSRRLLLLLEDRENSHKAEPFTKTKLRKRLSPLRYPGGKSKVIDQIYAYLDNERLDTFVELFAGGASLGLSLLDAGKIKKLVLNDLDRGVSNFWEAVLSRTDELIDRIGSGKPTMSEYWYAKEQLERYRFVSPSADYAYWFLLVNRLSYAGIAIANPICGKNGDDHALCQRWNPDALIQRIRHIASMSDRITIRHEDAVSFLLNEVGWYPERTTVFIDPPYSKAGKKLYPKTFEGQHEDLADAVNCFYRSWPGPDVILTYDNNPYIRELYPEADIKYLSTCWSITRPEKSTILHTEGII